MNKLLYDDLIKIKNENDFSELEINFYHEGKDLIPNGSQIKVMYIFIIIYKYFIYY